VSISSMMDAAYQRRSGVQTATVPADRGPETLAEIGQSTGESQATQSPLTSALESIMAYIPSEVVTTYVAVVAVLYPATDGAPAVASAVTGWVPFGVFLVLTPIVSWLIYAAKVANASEPLPIPVAKWPKWEMTVATVAFAIWAAALPNSPFNEFTWYSAGVAGIILLISSMMIGLMAPIFTRNKLET
jgi:hypothetical protein